MRRAIYEDDVIKLLDKGWKSGVYPVASNIHALPSAQPEPQEIGYTDCANAMLKMRIDNVLTDGEYSRIMDKLNTHWAERRADERLD